MHPYCQPTTRHRVLISAFNVLREPLSCMISTPVCEGTSVPLSHVRGPDARQPATSLEVRPRRRKRPSGSRTRRRERPYGSEAAEDRAASITACALPGVRRQLTCYGNARDLDWPLVPPSHRTNRIPISISALVNTRTYILYLSPAARRSCPLARSLLWHSRCATLCHASSSSTPYRSTPSAPFLPRPSLSPRSFVLFYPSLCLLPVKSRSLCEPPCPPWGAGGWLRTRERTRLRRRHRGFAPSPLAHFAEGAEGAEGCGRFSAPNFRHS
jgi:hypothetical protein